VGSHLLVDETKAKGYVVVVVACPDEALAVARKEIRRLILPGQRSVHMKQEGDRRRRQIIDVVVGLADQDVSATIVRVDGGGREGLLRERALREVVAIARESPDAQLVLDLDPGQLVRDRRVLSRAIAASGATASFRHAALAAEELLTLPDVVAWCWSRGHVWRRRILPVIDSAHWA